MGRKRSANRPAAPAAGPTDEQAAWDSADYLRAAERLGEAMGLRDSLAEALAAARLTVRRLERELKEAGWNVSLAAEHFRRYQGSPAGRAARAAAAGAGGNGLDGAPPGG